MSCGTGTRHPICGEQIVISSRQDIDQAFAKKLLRILAKQKVIVTSDEQERFIQFMSRSLRHRKLATQLLSRIQDGLDIIRWIQQARDDGNTDEAVWRCFLSAHFGRTSANHDNVNQVHSAARLLCAFGADPVWTWERVSTAPQVFRHWLMGHAIDLKSLAYGNHRKYESNRPAILWSVIESFISLARQFEGPSGLVMLDSSSDACRFDLLYERLKPIYRFGRTGRFDFLVLLLDLGMLAAQPTSCYLNGATGPRHGAEMLWGRKPVAELNRLADELAGQLRVSPIAVEDALCNWQK